MNKVDENVKEDPFTPERKNDYTVVGVGLSPFAKNSNHSGNVSFSPEKAKKLLDFKSLINKTP